MSRGVLILFLWCICIIGWILSPIEEILRLRFAFVKSWKAMHFNTVGEFYRREKLQGL